MHLLRQDSLLCYQALSGSLLLPEFFKHLHTVCGGLGFKFQRIFLRPCRHLEVKTAFRCMSHSELTKRAFPCCGTGNQRALSCPPSSPSHFPYSLCVKILLPRNPQTMNLSTAKDRRLAAVRLLWVKHCWYTMRTYWQNTGLPMAAVGEAKAATEEAQSSNYSLGSAVLSALSLAAQGHPTDSLKLVSHLGITKHIHAEAQTKLNLL